MENIVDVEVEGIPLSIDRLAVSGVSTLIWIDEISEGEYGHCAKLLKRVFGDSLGRVIDAMTEKLGREPVPQELIGFMGLAFKAMGEQTANEPKN